VRSVKQFQKVTGINNLKMTSLRPAAKHMMFVYCQSNYETAKLLFFLAAPIKRSSFPTLKSI